MSAFIMSQEYEPVLTEFKQLKLLTSQKCAVFTAFLNATICSTPGASELSYSAKSRRSVSKCTTDLSSPLLSRSSVCLVCRQETGFRVSVRSRRSWGNVEKGWGFWGFHKRGISL